MEKSINNSYQINDMNNINNMTNNTDAMQTKQDIMPEYNMGEQITQAELQYIQEWCEEMEAMRREEAQALAKELKEFLDDGGLEEIERIRQHPEELRVVMTL